MVSTKDKKTTVSIIRYGMGDGPEELRVLLLKNYLTLLEEGTLPAFITLYADGVKLALIGSPVLEQLASLEKKGVKILICKTCLNYFGKTGEVAAGTVATMVDIMDAQNYCDKLIVL